MLANFVSPYDATVIRKMEAEAGLVSLGKTNMDEFAMGSSNETSFFAGAQSVDNARVPAARPVLGRGVAARMAPARRYRHRRFDPPAGALCNLTGSADLWRRLALRHDAFASSLDQAGRWRPVPRLRPALNSMAGFDERDSTSLERRSKTTPRSGQPLKVCASACPRIFRRRLDADVMAAVRAAIAEYEKLGATTVEVSLPNSHLSVPAYYVIAPAEASSNLSRFDGVRYGYRAPEYDNLDDMYMKSRAQGFGAEVKRRIMIGAYVLSHGYYDAYYLQAQRIRRLIANDFVEAFKSCDVIMGPTSPTTAFKLGEKAADPVQMYLSDIYTIAVNLAGLPGMSVPCGLVGGLPVGLQLVGNYFAEAQLLNVAHRYQLATDWHQRRPAGLE